MARVRRDSKGRFAGGYGGGAHGQHRRPVVQRQVRMAKFKKRAKIGAAVVGVGALGYGALYGQHLVRYRSHYGGIKQAHGLRAMHGLARRNMQNSRINFATRNASYRTR